MKNCKKEHTKFNLRYWIWHKIFFGSVNSIQSFTAGLEFDITKFFYTIVNSIQKKFRDFPNFDKQNSNTGLVNFSHPYTWVNSNGWICWNNELTSSKFFWLKVRPKNVRTDRQTGGHMGSLYICKVFTFSLSYFRTFLNLWIHTYLVSSGQYTYIYIQSEICTK